jgi:uncharacterized membrane protein YqhA
VTTEPPSGTAPAAPEPPTDFRSPAFVIGILTVARLAMGIGIASLLAASITILVFGAVETYNHIALSLSEAGKDLSNREMFLASIKLIDLVLIATILQVVAIGIYSLFIDSRIPLPVWLRTADVDDLKFKLAGIVVVMLGVLFLELFITWAGDRDVLAPGLGVAAVIVALSYFIRVHPDKG